MNIFKFFRKKNKSITVQSIGELKYHKSKIGSTFYTYVENEKIGQNYELYIYSQLFKMPHEQVEYYNELVDNWDSLIEVIKVKVLKEKNLNLDKFTLKILGINEKGRDSYDAALVFTYKSLNFTVILQKFDILEIGYNK